MASQPAAAAQQQIEGGYDYGRNKERN